MSTLLERIRWTLVNNIGMSGTETAKAVIREIETTHKIIDPEDVTEKMIDACFTALPAHYDPPDPTRRPWHALKAKRRFTAMCEAAKSILED